MHTWSIILHTSTYHSCCIAWAIIAPRIQIVAENKYIKLEVTIWQFRFSSNTVNIVNVNFMRSSTKVADPYICIKLYELLHDRCRMILYGCMHIIL